MAERRIRSTSKDDKVFFTRKADGTATLTGPAKKKGLRLLEGPLPKQRAKTIIKPGALQQLFGRKKVRR